MTTRKHAFTLIELLLIIVVIAMLLTILLPALAAARRSARDTVCRSNLRQIVAAAKVYQADHDLLPPNRAALDGFAAGDNTATRWLPWVCPEGPHSPSAPVDNFTNPVAFGTYVYVTPLGANGHYSQRSWTNRMDAENTRQNVYLVSDPIIQLNPVRSFHPWRNAGYLAGHAGKLN